MSYSASITSRRYDPGAAIHPIHEFNLFVPEGPEPDGGWPVICFATLAGYTVTQTATVIDASTGATYGNGNLLAYLDAGIAIAWAHLPASRSDVIGTLAPKSQAVFDPSTKQFGPPYPKGSGAIVPHNGEVGDGWPGQNPTNYVGTQPWADPDWVFPGKAAAWLVQHLRYHGRGGTGELPINPDRIALEGGSAAAESFLFPALMPNVAGLLGLTGGQNDVSTRVRGIAAIEVPVLFSIYRTNVNGVHFAASASSPTYDEPAATLAAASSGWRYVGSPWVYGTNEGGLHPDLETLNQEVALWFTHREAISAGTLANANRYVSPPPFGTAGTGETNVHSAYNGYLLKSKYPHGRFVLGATAALDQQAEEGLVENGVGSDALITDAAARDADRLSWMKALLLDPVPVEEQVLSAVESALAEITVANGYQTEVRSVRRWDQTPGEVDVTPAVRLALVSTKSDDKAFANIVRKTTTVQLTLILRGEAIPEARLSRFIADVEKRLYVEEAQGGWLGGQVEDLSLTEWVRDAWADGATNFAAIDALLSVTYRHAIGDPYTPWPPEPA